jgi:hypothetical protein
MHGSVLARFAVGVVVSSPPNVERRKTGIASSSEARCSHQDATDIGQWCSGELEELEDMQ